MLTFVTLGPAGGNHAFVLHRYLALQGLSGSARICFTDDFHAGAAAVAQREADYLLQCAAHPDLAAVTGRHRGRIVPVDAFVAASQPMALVRSRAATCSGVVALQPATREYADLSGFRQERTMTTVSAVEQVLLAGQADGGIVFSRVLQEHPGRFELVQDLGSVRDAWVLFGREPVDEGEPVVWTQSPVARQFRSTQGVQQSR